MDEYLWVFIVIACLAIFGLIVVFGRKPKEAKPAFTLSTDDNPYEKEPEKRERKFSFCFIEGSSSLTFEITSKFTAFFIELGQNSKSLTLIIVFRESDS